MGLDGETHFAAGILNNFSGLSTTQTPELTIAVAVLGDGIFNLNSEVLPACDALRYDLFVQSAQEQHKIYCAEALIRSDIRVFFIDTLGAPHSRNSALEHAQTELLLYADDDLVFLSESYCDLRKAFATSPDIDFICARMTDEQGQPFKAYSSTGTAVNLRNCGKVGTPEIAIRVGRFREEDIWFDTDFGAGTEQPSGDEYIFLCDAMRSGLTGRHLDLFVACHPGQSTGHKHSVESFNTKEKVLRRALGRGSWPYRVAFAIKHASKFPNWSSVLRFVRF